MAPGLRQLAHAGLRQRRSARREIDRRRAAARRRGRHRSRQRRYRRASPCRPRRRPACRRPSGACRWRSRGCRSRRAPICPRQAPCRRGSGPSGPGNISGKMVRTICAPDLAHARRLPRSSAPLRSSFRSQVSSWPTPFTSIGPRGSNTKLSPSASLHRAGHLDLAGKPVQFEPRGEIHRLAPYVVGELVGADHPGHHRAAGDADPDLEIDAVRRGQPRDQIGQAAAPCARAAADGRLAGG